MAKGRDFAVFISYNSKDDAFARALNQFLSTQLGLKTWFDDMDVLGGDDLWPIIEDGISRSLVFLILFGESGMGRWQKEEIQLAKSLQTATDLPRIIPVRLPNFNETLKWDPILTRKSYIDLKTNPIAGMQKLIRSIHGGSQPLVSRNQENDYSDDEPYDQERRPFNFSAEVTKIVELLIGESLYSKKDVCVREIIQNAFDACVRRSIDEVIASRFNYEPKIVLNINTQQCWFEVDDNGQGMNPELLGNTFAIIGKSIREEPGILQSYSEKRASLIAQFGVGFVSTFMISKEIVISTTFTGHKQINFSIKNLEDGFLYTDSSQCGRKPDKVGTTIRIYLRDEFKKLDIRSIAESYARHVSNFNIIKNKKKIKKKDDWNISNAVIPRIIHGTDREHEFELRLGASINEGSFYASNMGFFISENVNTVMPFYTPSWIVGEVNLRGSVDLTISRDSMVENKKSRRIKREIQGYLAAYLQELADLTTEKAIANEKKGMKRKLRLIRSQLAEVILVYNYIWRNPKKGRKYTTEEPPLSLPQTDKLLKKLVEFEYGKKKSAVPLEKILEQMAAQKLDQAYFSYSWHGDFLQSMSDMLTEKGYLVFTTEQKKVLFRGSNKGNIKCALKDIIGPILNDEKISLGNIEKIKPEKFADQEVTLDDLPVKMEEIFQEQMNQLNLKRVKFIKLEQAPLIFQRKKTSYVNVAHPGYKELLGLLDNNSEAEAASYVKGLLSNISF